MKRKMIANAIDVGADFDLDAMRKAADEVKGISRALVEGDEDKLIEYINELGESKVERIVDMITAGFEKPQ